MVQLLHPSGAALEVVTTVTTITTAVPAVGKSSSP
jgi:hypothetical protein